jgi:hypothetical protein
LNDDAGFAGFVLLGILVWALWPGNGDNWNDKLWWSVKFDVPYSQVRMDPKPADCNFLQAPLGIKGCSFAPEVRVYNAEGVVVAGDNAPKYGNDTKTGRPIISFDNGQTWQWSGGPKPDMTTKSVVVRWTKAAN